MKIQLAEAGDLEGIRVIYNQAVRQKFCTAHLEEVDMSYIRKWFQAHDSERNPVYVIRKEAELCAWYSLGSYREGRQAFHHVGELSYYVHDNYRKQGLGSALLEHAIQKAPSCAYSTLIAILLERNIPSIALLEKYNFIKWASLPGIAHIGDERIDHQYYGLEL